MGDLVYTSIIAIAIVGALLITGAIITSTPIRFKLWVRSNQIEVAAEMALLEQKKDD